MIDKSDFKRMRDGLADYDRCREQLIKKARDVLKLSKQLIYSIHRRDFKEADNLAGILKKEKEALDKIASNNCKLQFEGSYSESVQEYVEALSYHGLIRHNKIPLISSLKANEEDYLMGICDLTGELTRRAVTIAHKDKKEVEKIKELVEELFGEFLKFDLRNGELRKKSDSIKWNLKKLEEIMYDIKRK